MMHDQPCKHTRQQLKDKTVCMFTAVFIITTCVSIVASLNIGIDYTCN